MADKYRVKLSDGSTYDIEVPTGSPAPTEDEIQSHLAGAMPQQETTPPTPYARAVAATKQGGLPAGIGSVAKDVAANAVPSLFQLGGNMMTGMGGALEGLYGAVRHPIETVKNIPKLPSAIASGAGAVVEDLKRKYGSGEAIINTIGGDPAAVAGDVAAAAGGIGLAAKAVPMAGRLSRAAMAVSDVANPMTAVPMAIGAVTGGPRAKLAERMYQSALKPSTALEHTDVKELVRTGIGEGIPLGEGGLKLTRDIIDGINARVAKGVADAAAAGVTVDPQKVATFTDRVRSIVQNSTHKDAMLAAVDAEVDAFFRNQAGAKPAVPPQMTGGLTRQNYMTPGTPAVPPQPIPIDKAQLVKQQMGRELSGKFGELTNVAGAEGMKDIRYGLANEIYGELEKIDPGVKSLGKKEKVLIDLEGIIGRMENRMGNQLPVSVPGFLGGGAVTLMTGSRTAGGITGALVQLLQKNPELTSRIALALSPASPRGGFVPWAQPIVRRGAIPFGTIGSAQQAQQ